MQLASLPAYLVVLFHSRIITGGGKAFPTNINDGQTTHPTPTHCYFDKSPPHPEGHNEVHNIHPKPASRSTHAVINLFAFNSLLRRPWATCTPFSCRALQEHEACTAAQAFVSFLPRLLPFSQPPPAKPQPAASSEVLPKKKGNCRKKNYHLQALMNWDGLQKMENLTGKEVSL